MNGKFRSASYLRRQVDDSEGHQHQKRGHNPSLLLKGHLPDFFSKSSFQMLPKEPTFDNQKNVVAGLLGGRSTRCTSPLLNGESSARGPWNFWGSWFLGFMAPFCTFFSGHGLWNRWMCGCSVGGHGGSPELVDTSYIYIYLYNIIYIYISILPPPLFLRSASMWLCRRVLSKRLKVQSQAKTRKVQVGTVGVFHQGHSYHYHGNWPVKN